ncbi:MAG: transcriptional regulator [Candidatus Parcubacteria bacterium]|nr:MAG: transcriptional regulator [Candidatus Parcubacteria bacterium]
MAKGNIIKAKDLAQKLVDKFNTTKKEAVEIIEFLKTEIVNNLKSGYQVKIAGLGTFKVRQRKERMALNPKTGEKVLVPATKVPKFTPAKDLKEAVK